MTELTAEARVTGSQHTLQSVSWPAADGDSKSRRQRYEILAHLSQGSVDARYHHNEKSRGFREHIVDGRSFLCVEWSRC